MTLDEIMRDEAQQLGFDSEAILAAMLFSKAQQPSANIHLQASRQIPPELEELIRRYMRLHLIRGTIDLKFLKEAIETTKRKIENN